MASFNPPQDFYCPITGDLMKDPVVDPDGHSYEKDAIMKWLSTKNVSPMTRNTLIPTDLRPNLSLKNSIEAIRGQLSADQLKIASRIFEKENEEFTKNLKDLKTKISVNDNQLCFSISVPDVKVRPPVDVCLTIDVSGSMGSEATLKGDKGETINHGYSVLSVTVCAAKTVLSSLNENDNISIVTYTDKASILVDYWSVSTENKKLIEELLDKLVPLNTTNIWDGLKVSLDILRTKSPKNRMKGVFLLTDGVPNVEPARGHEYMLDKYYKDHTGFNCMINCYGFGYQLMSDLLQNISKISGGDGFAFIPDSSLLGNIFIHGISNFLSTATFGSELNIKLFDKFTFKDKSLYKNIIIPSIKYGQTKHILFDLSEFTAEEESLCIGDCELKVNDHEFHYEIMDCGTNNSEQVCRMKAIETLINCLDQMKFNEKNMVKTLIVSFLEYARKLNQTEYIKNIIFDFEGQVKESLNMTNVGEKEDWFSKWGVHYLRSLSDAYENEICNNFKDKGVSNFGGELFNSLRDEISDIFDSLPPPKATIPVCTYGSTNMRGGGPPPPTRSLQPVQSMASYNYSGGGCCAKGSHIEMADNTLRKVEDINTGDKVITFDSLTNEYITSSVECVVITKCHRGKADMVKLEGNSGNTLSITPYHPVYLNTIINSGWRFPIDISSFKPINIDCEEMFTFVIKNRKSVIIEDYVFATYGHNLKGDVINHDYFGTEKVINDLRILETYKLGYVYLKKEMFIRHGGRVSAIMKRPNPFIHSLHLACL